MKKALAIWIFLGCVTGLNAAEEMYVPREIFALEVDGVRHSIELDKPIDPKLVAAAKSVVVRAAGHRVFEHGGAYFHIPRDTSVAKKPTQDGGLRWDFQRSKFKFSIMLVPLNDNTAELKAAFVEGLRESMPDAVARFQPVELALKSGVIKGERMMFEVAGGQFQLDLYSLKCAKGTLMLLMPQSEDLRFEEAKEARTMFLETFKVK